VAEEFGGVFLHEVEYVEDNDIEHLSFAIILQAHEQFLQLNQRTELNFDLPEIPEQNRRIPATSPTPAPPVPYNAPMLIDLPAHIREHPPTIALLHNGSLQSAVPVNRTVLQGGSIKWVMRPTQGDGTRCFMADNDVVMSALARIQAPSGQGRGRRTQPIPPPSHTPFHMAHEHLQGGSGGVRWRWSTKHPFIGMLLRVKPLVSDIPVNPPILPTSPPSNTVTVAVVAFCQPSSCPQPSFLAQCLTHPDHFYFIPKVTALLNARDALDNTRLQRGLPLQAHRARGALSPAPAKQISKAESEPLRIASLMTRPNSTTWASWSWTSNSQAGPYLHIEKLLGPCFEWQLKDKLLAGNCG